LKKALVLSKTENDQLRLTEIEPNIDEDITAELKTIELKNLPRGQTEISSAHILPESV
jgi:hypothetical protein